MQIAGSCHCNRVTFTALTRTPVPFMYCYCTICRKVVAAACSSCPQAHSFLCRKTDGGAGSACNIMVKGSEHLNIYRADLNRGKGACRLAGNLRHFCRQCGCHLYAWDPKWAESFYPLASAIDTDLPTPEERYPDVGLADWHREHGHYLSE